jgi:hypothetical protein
VRQGRVIRWCGWRLTRDGLPSAACLNGGFTFLPDFFKLVGELDEEMIPINILNGEASDMMALNDFRDFFHFHGGCQLLAPGNLAPLSRWRGWWEERGYLKGPLPCFLAIVPSGKPKNSSGVFDAR